MLTPFSVYSRAVNRQECDKLHILTHMVHERHNSIWARTGHEFYGLPSAERWKWNSRNIEPPANIHFIEKVSYGQDVEYDLYVSQTLQQASEYGRNICKAFNLPHITVFHTLRSAINANYSERYWKHIAKNSVASHHVFITEAQMADWNGELFQNPVVIRHGIDTEVFCGWKPGGDYALNVSNDFIGRGYIMGWDIAQAVLDGVKTKYVGDTLNLDGSRFSNSSETLYQLADEYRNCGVYFSCTRLSSISTALLEAMATGCPCVIYDTFSVKDYFSDGVHCFISNNPRILRDRLVWCLENPDKACEMGQAARSRIEELFSVDLHIKQWNSLFSEVIGKNHER